MKEGVSLKRQRERCSQSDDSQQGCASLAGGGGTTTEGVCASIGSTNGVNDTVSKYEYS
jgi:hypothetical protein